MSDCRLKYCEDKFAEFTNLLLEIIRDWMIISDNNAILLQHLIEIREIIEHIHQNHLHGKFHYVDERKDPGLKSGCPAISNMDRLLREIEIQSDRDGNGAVYGDSFIFKDSDPNVSRAIRDTQKQLEQEFGRLSDNFTTVKKYFDSFNIPLKCYSAAQYDPIANAMIQLILGYNPNAKSNKELVYGKDYIIDPNDKQKPKILTELENKIFSK